MKSLSTAERSKICEILSENDGEFLMSIDDFIEVRKEVEIFFLFYVRGHSTTTCTNFDL